MLCRGHRPGRRSGGWRAQRLSVGKIGLAEAENDEKGAGKESEESKERENKERDGKEREGGKCTESAGEGMHRVCGVSSFKYEQTCSSLAPANLNSSWGCRMTRIAILDRAEMNAEQARR